MTEADKPLVEGVRRWPVWFARLANRIIGWTDMYCAGGCGYPVTGLYDIEVDKIKGTSVKMMLCSLDSDCSRKVEATQAADDTGMRYSEIRPQLVAMPHEADVYRLHLTRD